MWNLWREWARLEVGNLRGETYVLPEVIESYPRAVCCAWPRRQYPTPADLRLLKLWFASRKHHAGLIVRSENPGRIKKLLEEYGARV